MNYLAYINGVANSDTMLTVDDCILFNKAPPMGAQIAISIEGGWSQGFVGDGFTNKFPLSNQILKSIDRGDNMLKYKQILHDAMRHLENDAIQAEVERLATVIAMVREYGH